VQADLRVVRKGNAYLITGKDHANELAEEAFQARDEEGGIGPAQDHAAPAARGQVSRDV